MAEWPLVESVLVRAAPKVPTSTVDNSFISILIWTQRQGAI